MRKKLIMGICMLLLINLALLGCGSQETSKDEDRGEALQIITTISILGDIAEAIAGGRGNVEYLVPVGTNPEDYELLSSDLQKISDADVFFLNGWALEEVIERALSNVSDSKIVYVTEGITPISLVGGNEPDPHAWFDATLVADYYVRNMVEALTELDPAGEEVYWQNGAQYVAQLEELDAWIKAEVERIPVENRVIVISENALKYYGEAYGFRTEGVWELNSHEEGTPQQISRVVDLVNQEGLPAIFVETTLDPRYMETVSGETGVPIGGKLYTDALGVVGSGAETYCDMMKYNTEVLVENLSQ